MISTRVIRTQFLNKFSENKIILIQNSSLKKDLYQGHKYRDGFFLQTILSQQIA